MKILNENLPFKTHGTHKQLQNLHVRYAMQRNQTWQGVSKVNASGVLSEVACCLGIEASYAAKCLLSIQLQSVWFPTKRYAIIFLHATRFIVNISIPPGYKHFLKSWKWVQPRIPEGFLRAGNASSKPWKCSLYFWSGWLGNIRHFRSLTSLTSGQVWSLDRQGCVRQSTRDNWLQFTDGNMFWMKRKLDLDSMEYGHQVSFGVTTPTELSTKVHDCSDNTCENGWGGRGGCNSCASRT